MRTLLALSLIWAASASRGSAAAALPGGLLLAGAVQENSVLVVGERGSIHRSADGGSSWQRVPAPVRVALTGVAFAPEGPKAWAVGHEAVILASVDRGATWSIQYRAPNVQDSLLDVIALDGGHIIAVGAYGLCLESLDEGRSWQRRRLNADDLHFNRITRGPTGDLFIAGERGTLLRSRDRGVRWEALKAPYEGSFYGILALDRRTLMAYGLRGRVFRSADDGATWRPVETGVEGLLASGLQLRSNFILLAGSVRGALISRNYGETFELLAGSPASAVATMLALPDGSVLALGEDGAVALPAPR